MLHYWHKTAGILAAVFVIILCVTGVLLNHAGELQLDENYLQNELLLGMYDIRVEGKPVSYAVEGGHITHLVDRLYFNDREMPVRSDRLIGAVTHGELVVVATPGELHLLNEKGELVETLSGYDGVPAGMSRIGINEWSEFVIEGVHGDYLYDLEDLAWQGYDELSAVWAEAVATPGHLAQQLVSLYRGRGLSMERFLLDLHSGRIFGPVGVYFVDLVAVALLFLALSGSWMWFKSRAVNNKP